MRYLVTGAAGFIGSHLAEALRAEGHEVVGLDCFTDYYDVALKEENARGQEILRLDLARDPIDLDGFDGVFHLAGQPGVRSFGDVFETYLDRNVLASQRLFEAAARDGVRVVFASSSSIYGDAEAYPTPEDVVAAAGLAVRDHEARAASTSPARRRGASASTSSCCATSPSTARASGPTWRSRGSRCASPRAARSTSSATAASRAASRTSATSSARRSLAMERGRGTYNVGGGEEATMLETIALLEELAGRPLEIRDASRRAGRPAAHEGRHDADPERARLGADDVSAGRSRGPVGVGRC